MDEKVKGSKKRTHDTNINTAAVSIESVKRGRQPFVGGWLEGDARRLLSRRRKMSSGSLRDFVVGGENIHRCVVSKCGRERTPRGFRLRSAAARASLMQQGLQRSLAQDSMQHTSFWNPNRCKKNRFHQYIRLSGDARSFYLAFMIT